MRWALQPFASGTGMHIAEIAPLAESVPPSHYGGTERVLTDELVGLGDKVTLFASGGSKIMAELVPISPKPLRLSRPPDRPNFRAHPFARTTPHSRSRSYAVCCSASLSCLRTSHQLHTRKLSTTKAVIEIHKVGYEWLARAAAFDRPGRHGRQLSSRSSSFCHQHQDSDSIRPLYAADRARRDR